jgi:hypothetical protein
MIRRISILAVLAVTVSGGCAQIPGLGRPDPASEFEVGIEALDRGDYATGFDVLYPIYRRHWDQAIGQRALMALMAAEIDPRNDNRRLWSTADMAATYLQIPEVPSWTMPVARAIYLLSIELGATEERVARAEAERDQAQARAATAERQRTAQAGASPERGLPEFTGQTVPARLRAVEGERDELRRRVQQLEQRLAERERQLRENEQELERIRRTIRG